MNHSSCVVILAAGQGKRMHSELPKVLHHVCGKPLLVQILDKIHKAWWRASQQNLALPVAIVVGHKKELVMDTVNRRRLDWPSLQIEFVVQGEQKGTGHAVQCVMESDWGRESVLDQRDVLILPGDLPLVESELIEHMLKPFKETIHLLSTNLEDPTGYGRVLKKNKKIYAIIEQKDASAAQKKVKEVAVSIYSFKSTFLVKALKKIKPQNAQGEYYLTDLISIGVKEKKTIKSTLWKNDEDLRGINDLWELTVAQGILNARLIQKWAKLGVRFDLPDTCLIESDVKLSEGCQIEPGVVLKGKTTIGARVFIGAHSILTDCQIDEDVVIHPGCIFDQSKVMRAAIMGPYARLRPESKVGSESKIGNFVELKKTNVGSKTSVAHLSYLGDADVGSHVNVGCGFVTCNFDGRVINGSRKHKTIIEDHVFVGSDCQTVAPVKLGQGSFIASGSTITQDVEPESLAIARSRQINKPGYVKKQRE